VSAVEKRHGFVVGVTHASAVSVLARWTENGTIVWPGTFPRHPREPTFVEYDEKTLKRRSLYERIVTPESAMLDQREIWRVVGAYRARIARRERRSAIARVACAIVLGAIFGASAASVTVGRAASTTITVRAAPPEKVLVHAVERRGRHGH
jgi:hypothetical protein